GGNGFSAEYNASRAYRDSRINRIYEGTNEINRLLILDMTLKRAMGGRLDLMGPAMGVQKELMSIPDFSEDDTPFAAERKLIANLKKAILMASGAAVQKLMMKIENEQEILMNISDMAIETFNAESVLLRVMKMVEEKGEANSQVYLDMMRTYLYDAADRVNKSGKDAINSFSDGDEQKMILIGLKRFTKAEPFNTKDARRRIADQMIAAGKYCF
ncbi:MAG TPA: acyl-CoA dehydrogenase family protein, partial [Chitinophagaceae bacterium]|nr:acyl-CoA dehydrogenase family protein [Chitinophagaceae bacterium]